MYTVDEAWREIFSMGWGEGGRAKKGREETAMSIVGGFVVCCCFYSLEKRLFVIGKITVELVFLVVYNIFIQRGKKLVLSSSGESGN